MIPEQRPLQVKSLILRCCEPSDVSITTSAPSNRQHDLSLTGNVGFDGELAEPACFYGRCGYHSQHFPTAKY